MAMTARVFETWIVEQATQIAARDEAAPLFFGAEDNGQVTVVPLGEAIGPGPDDGQKCGKMVAWLQSLMRERRIERAAIVREYDLRPLPDLALGAQRFLVITFQSVGSMTERLYRIAFDDEGKRLGIQEFKPKIQGVPCYQLFT